MGQLVAGRYRVVRPLGAGGISHVWLALDKRTGRQVAIKRCALPDGLAEPEQDLVRGWLPDEARASAAVRHPHVIRIHDVVSDGDLPWIVMEYVPSRSLQQAVRRSGPVAPARAAEIGLALLDGLAAAGRAGVLHLDVKPGNVLIADDGRVVLSDFGPAVTPAGIEALTGAGIILGSPNYIAPERLFDGISTDRSDLWSLGATLSFAATGRPPFLRDSTDETLRALEDPAPDLPPGELGELIGGLLRRDPADRISATEVGERLRAIAAGPGLPGVRPEHAPVADPTPSGVRPEHVPVAAAAETDSDARIAVSSRTPAARTDPDADPPSRTTAVRRRLAIAAAVVAVGAVLAAAATAASRPDAPSAAPVPPPASPSSPSSTSPSVSRSPFVLPDGFRWQDEPDFRVAVPQSWEPVSGGGAGQAGPTFAGQTFAAPGGRPLLRISEWAEPPDDLVGALVGEEQRTRADAYRRIRIGTAPATPGVVWEYLYRDADGVAMRCLQRIVTAAGRTYRLEWRAPREDWTAGLPVFDVALASFGPARGA